MTEEGGWGDFSPNSDDSKAFTNPHGKRLCRLFLYVVEVPSNASCLCVQFVTY